MSGKLCAYSSKKYLLNLRLFHRLKAERTQRQMQMIWSISAAVAWSAFAGVQFSSVLMEFHEPAKIILNASLGISFFTVLISFLSIMTTLFAHLNRLGKSAIRRELECLEIRPCDLAESGGATKNHSDSADRARRDVRRGVFIVDFVSLSLTAVAQLSVAWGDLGESLKSRVVGLSAMPCIDYLSKILCLWGPLTMGIYHCMRLRGAQSSEEESRHGGAIRLEALKFVSAGCIVMGRTLFSSETKLAIRETGLLRSSIGGVMVLGLLFRVLSAAIGCYVFAVGMDALASKTESRLADVNSAAEMCFAHAT